MGKTVTYISLVRPALLVLVPLGIGIVARRLKLLKPAFRIVYLLVLWAVLPALVFGVVAIERPFGIFTLSSAAILACIGLGTTSALSATITYLARMNREKSIAVFLNASFMNYTFLGLAVVYSVIGIEGLGAASIYAVAMGVIHLSVGVALAAGGSRKKKVKVRTVILSILTFPAAFALIVALLFVGFDAAIPHWEQAKEAVGTFVTPAVILMTLTAGYQMPLVDPRKYLSSITIVGTVRLIACPLATHMAALLLGFAGEIAGSSLLLSCMPPGVFNIILAERFGLDLKLYGASIFYLTVLSLFVVVPVLVFLGALP